LNRADRTGPIENGDGHASVMIALFRQDATGFFVAGAIRTAR